MYTPDNTSVLRPLENSTFTNVNRVTDANTTIAISITSITHTIIIVCSTQYSISICTTIISAFTIGSNSESGLRDGKDEELNGDGNSASNGILGGKKIN